MHEHMRSNRACARKAVDPMAAFIDRQGARSPPQGDNNGFTSGKRAKAIGARSWTTASVACLP